MQNKILAVERAPGDMILASVLGDTTQAGIPADLAPDHLAIDRQAGNIGGTSIDLENLAALYRLQGNLVEARRNYLQSLELPQHIVSPEGIAICLEGLAIVAILSEAGAESRARLYGAAEALRNSIGMPLWESYKADSMLE